MAHAIYEWVYIAAVVAILIYVGAASWNVERIIEEVPADAETIKVSGQQWFWSFEHADGTKEINELHVEQGKPYRFEMTSLDVNHNFNIPDFTILMDVIPGRINTLWNMFDQPGEYLIQCREYCGFSHYAMKAKLFVEPATAAAEPETAESEAAEAGSTTTTGKVTTPTVPSTQPSPETGQRAAVGTQPGEEGVAPGTEAGNATTTTTAGGQEGGGGAAAGGVTLTILEGSSLQGNPDYEPDELTVKKGDTISVNNVDTMPHTVTNGESASDPNSAKLFDTSIIMGGESAELDTSNVDAGTHPFYCTVHPYMTGSLTVE